MNELSYCWPEHRSCAVALSFDFDGEAPYLWRTRANPPKGVGELEQRRFGPREGIYRILALLKSRSIRATFFVPGYIAKHYPQAVEKIAYDGHEIALHGYLHERVDELSEAEITETTQQAQAELGKIIGNKPLGYRSPSWEMSKSMLTALKKHEVLYDSSLMGYDHPYWLEGIAEVPVQWLLDDVIFYRYTGGGGNSPRNPADVVDLWQQEFIGIKRYGGLFLLTMHPWVSGRASRILALEKLIDLLQQHTDVWWATCAEIADYHKMAYPTSFQERLP